MSLGRLTGMRPVVLAVALLPVAFLAACGAGDSAPPGGSHDPSQLYEADGTVLDDADGPKLCLGGIAESYPPQCSGLRLVGWDWNAVEGEESASGTTWGDFHLVGTYDGEVFTVAEARPSDPAVAAAGFGGERNFTTPCPEPEGGWIPIDPSRISDESFAAGAAVAESRPGHVALWVDYVGDHTPEELDQLAVEGKPVLQIMNVVVTDDVAGTEAAISERWGGPLCVTQREGKTEAELMAIRQQAERLIVEELGLETTWSMDGDLGLAAEIGVVVDPGDAGQAALDERYGPGMAKLFPALVPVTE